MAKKRPINAFIIDDQQDYIESLKPSARDKGIILNSSRNLEEGIEYIKTHKNIEFVILDGKCFADADQETKGGKTSSNIPMLAKSQLDDINREQNRTIHYCVNTAFHEDFREYLKDVFEVFEKDDATPLLDYIKKQVQNSEQYKLKNKYYECFTVFDEGIIDSTNESLFVDVLTSLSKSDYRKKNISPMRDLLEASFHGLIDMGCIPNTFLNEHGNPNLEWCTRYMEQRPTDDTNGVSHTLNNAVPQEMKSTLRKLKESTSSLSHLNDAELVKYPFLANAHLLMEYLVWLPKFYTTHYK